MAKFMISVGDSIFKIIESEAKKRHVTVQELMRAVIVPEWVRENLEVDPTLTSPRGIAPHLMHQSNLSQPKRSNATGLS